MPNYLKITAIADSSVSFSFDESSPCNLEVSTDGTTFAAYTDTISLTAGNSLYFRGNNPSGLNSVSKCNKFDITGDVSVSGDITTLIDYNGSVDEIPDTGTSENRCFESLFNSCNISDASGLLLPSTKLKSYCYFNLFYYCTKLVNAPETLPATILMPSCYSFMFYRCTNLLKAPTLPAKELVDGCYYNMFERCSKLNYIECLAETGMGDNTDSWVNKVQTTSGTFVKAKGAEWETGTSGIPNNWTVVNKETPSIEDKSNIYNVSKMQLKKLGDMNEYNTTYEIKKAQVTALGGDLSKVNDIYSAEIEILNKLNTK